MKRRCGERWRARIATRGRLYVTDDEALEIVQDLHQYTARLEIRNAPEKKGQPE